MGKKKQYQEERRNRKLYYLNDCMLRTVQSQSQHDLDRPSEKPPGQPRKHNPAHHTQNTVATARFRKGRGTKTPILIISKTIKCQS